MKLDEYLKIEKEMDVEMSKIWDKPFFDGITNYELYKKSPIKILWILKEPNGKGGGNHRIFHEDIRNYNRWKSTYGNIMRVGYAILDGISEFKEIPSIDTKECTIANVPVLDEVAIININKSAGGSVTPIGKLDIEYKRDGVKEYLLKQIEFMNPEIIINSHGVYKFFLDQIENNEVKKVHGEQYAINKKRLIIWTSHPNRAPKESYCNNILNIINNCKSKNNGT